MNNLLRKPAVMQFFMDPAPQEGRGGAKDEWPPSAVRKACSSSSSPLLAWWGFGACGLKAQSIYCPDPGVLNVHISGSRVA